MKKIFFALSILSIVLLDQAYSGVNSESQDAYTFQDTTRRKTDRVRPADYPDTIPSRYDHRHTTDTLGPDTLYDKIPDTLPNRNKINNKTR